MGGHRFHIPTDIPCSIIALTAVVCLTGCVFPHRSGPGLTAAAAIETRVLSLRDNAAVEPVDLNVRSGTVVIWLNQSGSDIRIMLHDPKVAISCLSPVNFDITAEGCFTSGRLMPGAVASLCFVQTGTYAYSVERLSGAGQSQLDGMRPEGAITVR
jgi:hypothetical protein